MDSARPQRVRFLHVTDPTVVDRHARRQMRSHVARETHARARRVRLANYLGLSNNSTSNAEIPPAPETPQSHLVHEESAGPSPATTLSSARRDPFSAFVRSLRPIEHFLLDHYVRVIIPASSNTCTALRTSAEGVYYTHHMTVDWVPLALADAGLLSGILTASCRDLSVSTSENDQKYRFATMAIRYKLDCLRALADSLAAETAAALEDSALAKVIALVTDEIALRNIQACRSHLLGAMKMTDLRGGPENLGLNGLLAFILQRMIHDKGIFQQRPDWGTRPDGLVS